MERLIPLLTMVLGMAAWQFFLEKSSRGSQLRPLGTAFGLTSSAAILLISGAIGYRLDRHDRFAAGTAWSGHVLWWQVLIGAVIGLVAIYFWRKGLAEASRERRRA
jgi:hypothetical protein